MALTKISGKALPTGSVIQTEQAIVTTHKTLTSTSYTDTGITGSITPRFADSKILVRFAVQLGAAGANTHEIYIRLMRGSTEIETYERPIHIGNLTSGAGNMHSDTMAIFEFLDSPASTSSVTYKLQGKVSSGNMRINDYAANATGSASMVTMQEIVQ